MSQTTTWAIPTGNSSRKRRTTGATTGTGANERLYVGRDGSYDYDAYLKPTVSWTGIGTLVSATLVLYSHGGDSLFPLPGSADAPKVMVRRLTAAFSEGSSATWASNNYVAPKYTSTNNVPKLMNKAADGETRINITSLVRAWAPATVAGGKGTAAQATARTFGLALHGYASEVNSWAGYSDDYSDAELRPYVEIVSEYGATVPTTPSGMSPDGNVSALTAFEAVFADPRPTDFLKYSEVEVKDGTVVVYTEKLPASDTDAVNALSHHVPNTTSWIVANHAYTWRMRHWDQEGQVSAWSAATNLTVTNTAPTAPVLTPLAKTFDSLDGVLFSGGTFVDANADTLFAYQVQLSTYASGNGGWDTGDLKWNTGKLSVANGATEFRIPYGGESLAAGTYHWRARVWDSKDTPSNWTYTSIILTTDFDVLSGETTSIQLRPRAPWRIRIMEMEYNTVGGALTGVSATNVITSASAHGVVVGQHVRFSALTGGAGLTVGKDYWVLTTPATTTFTVSEAVGGSVVDFTTTITAGTLTAVTTRGPGNVVAILEDASNVGASELYNSPGELHFTLLKDHPQISVIEPKLTHYGVDFYSGDGWREVFAGLMWDFDANDKDIVFYGIDYLALYDLVIDERYDASNPDKPAESGGSKYITAAKNTIAYIIDNQLDTAKALANSPVGFITVAAVPSFSETMTVYSTYSRVLTFIAGLLDSHRAGSGKRSRISVRKATGGGYEVVVEDNPGVARDNLRLKYGELVQGYRVIPYGSDWGTSVAGIGRARDGVRVMYKRASPFASNLAYEKTYGRFTFPTFVDGVIDDKDLARRVSQTAIGNATLGKSMGLGIRSGILQPKDGYNICDRFPVSISDGPVNTENFGGGYWNCMGVTWVAGNIGEQTTILTLLPLEDGVTPSEDLLTLSPISPQDRWQVGWVAPDPLNQPLEDGSIWVDSRNGHINRWSSELQAWVDQTALDPNNPRALADTTIVWEDYGQSIPGGHNVIRNSGFELISFATATETWLEAPWTTTGQFTGSDVRTPTNITLGESLTVTTQTY